MPVISFIEKDGGCRPMVISGDLIVLPGTYELTQAQWDIVRATKGCAGYIARGELYDEANPPPRTPRAPQNADAGAAGAARAADAGAAGAGAGAAGAGAAGAGAGGDDAPSASDIADFLKEISGMSVEDATPHIENLEIKAALVALISKDNRSEIVNLAQARLVALR